MFARPSWIDRFGYSALLGFAFFLPISTFMSNVMVGLVLISWLAGGRWAQKWAQCREFPLVSSMLLFIGICMLGLAHTTVTLPEAWPALIHPVRFIYILALIWFLQDAADRERVISVFLIAMGLTFVCGLLKKYGYLHIGARYSEVAPFRDHIKTNFLMAVAAFFIFHRMVQYPRWRSYYGVALVLCMYYGFFLSVGRTGYIIFVLLLSLAAIQRYRLRGLAGMLGVFAAVFVMNVLTYGPLYARTLEVYCDALAHPEACARCAEMPAVRQRGEANVTSAQQRFQFLEQSWELAQAHLWLGTGPGSFRARYAAQAAEKGLMVTANPHNAYMYVLVEYGLVGLGAFLAFFGQQLLAQRRLPRDDRHRAQGVFLIYIIGCFANAWLIDFTEFHLWVLLLALAYHAPKSLIHRS